MTRVIEPLERRTLLSVSIPAVADAAVVRSTADATSLRSNFGHDAQLRVNVDTNNSAESFITFDLAQVGDVGNAVLRLSGGRSDGSTTPILVGAFAVPQAGWVEGNGTAASPDTDNTPAGEISWDNRPSTSGGAIDAAFVARNGDYYWNVTTYVRAQKQAGASSVSFALRGVDTAAGLMTFGAREAGVAGPTLIVEPNASGPVASFTAPNLTAATPTQTVTATFTDADGVDVSSIGVDDITVTAPGLPAAQVTSVSVTPSSGTSVTAVYTVTGPGGDWSADDSSLYTTMLQSGQVTDLAGNPAAGGPDAFFVSIGAGSPGSSDGAAPTAQVSAPDVTQAGGATGSFTVTYSDDTAINVSTIDVGDVVVVRPGSPTLRITGVQVSPASNGSPITATYTFAAPGGSWSETDNGTYQVQLLDGAVADVAGRLTPAKVATFNVAVPVSPPAAGDTTPPTAVIAALPPITAEGVTSQQVQVSYTDETAVDVGSIDVSDIVVSLNGVELPVIAVSANPPADGQVITAIYTVSAPGTAFALADNGTYSITIAAGAVVDTSGNGVAVTTGSFQVALPAPEPAVDPTFGDGTVVSDFIAEGSVVQTDGRVLVVGRTGDLAAGNSQGVLQRLNPDGSLDRTFGQQGRVVTAGGNDAYFAVRLTATGLIVVGGTSDGNFALTRFKNNGAVDRSFGTGGRAVADFAGTDVAYALAVGADGSIVAGGSSSSGTGTSFALARFLSDGKKDVFFGDDGRSLFLNSTEQQAVAGLAIQTDGKIIAAGCSGGSVVVVRVGTDGLQDQSYGDNGIAVISGLTTRGDLGQPDYTIGLALQDDDRAVVANRTSDGDFGIARLTSSGTLDSTFGSAGFAKVDFGGDDDADNLVIQGTGELFAIGTTTSGDKTSTAVAALGHDGTLDKSFGNSGKIVVDTVTSSGTALHIGDLVLRAFATISPDGRLVVGSSTPAPAVATPQTGLRRLNVPGSGLVGLFGLVEGKNRTITVLDNDGTRITLSLKGGGTGRAYFDGTNLDFVVSGTVGTSAMKIKAVGGDGLVKLRNFQSDGAMRSVIATTADLVGTLAVDGSLQSLRLHSVFGTIATTGSIGTVQLSGNLDGGRILAGADLGSDGKFGGDGTGADTFAAASLATLSIRGKANAALVATGVDPNNGIYLDSDDQPIGGTGSVINNVNVRGGADLSSRFVAGRFGKVRVPTIIGIGDSRLETL